MSSSTSVQPMDQMSPLEAGALFLFWGGEGEGGRGGVDGGYRGAWAFCFQR